MRVVARRALTVFNLSAVPIFSLYYYELETSEFNISGVWVRVILIPKAKSCNTAKHHGQAFHPTWYP